MTSEATPAESSSERRADLAGDAEPPRTTPVKGGRSLAAGLIGAVQIIGGFVVGWLTGLYGFPRIVRMLQRALGITGPDGLVRTAGYWTIWIVVFAALSGVCLAAATNRRTRRFGIAVTASFAPVALMVATVFIAFDS
ncbi:hypothetical protein [Nocardia sp. NBC_00403]|uniref:hypothetical protein n=1 Tax=Nocardia sp. NBC_00403 TaxID=2975990 RepID=UPI002E1F9A8C